MRWAPTTTPVWVVGSSCVDERYSGRIGVHMFPEKDEDLDQVVYLPAECRDLVRRGAYVVLEGLREVAPPLWWVADNVRPNRLPEREEYR
jgi:hypothetical protein